MNSLKEIVKTIQDLELLIDRMDNEINLLRNIVFRYNSMHGNKIKDGSLIVPDNLSFSISIDENKEIVCLVSDRDKLGITSNFQKIKSEIKKIT